VPQVGEHVGMMVVAGSTRSDDNTPVEERTKLIAFAWPGPGGARKIQPLWVEGQQQTGGNGSGIPEIPDASGVVGDILARLAVLDRKLDGLTRQIDASTERLQQQIAQAAKP